MDIDKNTDIFERTYHIELCFEGSYVIQTEDDDVVYTYEDKAAAADFLIGWLLDSMKDTKTNTMKLKVRLESEEVESFFPNKQIIF